MIVELITSPTFVIRRIKIMKNFFFLVARWKKMTYLVYRLRVKAFTVLETDLCYQFFLVWENLRFLVFWFSIWRINKSAWFCDIRVPILDTSESFISLACDLLNGVSAKNIKYITTVAFPQFVSLLNASIYPSSEFIMLNWLPARKGRGKNWLYSKTENLTALSPPVAYYTNINAISLAGMLWVRFKTKFLGS